MPVQPHPMPITRNGRTVLTCGACGTSGHFVLSKRDGRFVGPCCGGVS